METILVLGDEPELRASINRALASHAVHIEFVESGDHALTRIANNGTDYSLLLIDLDMKPGGGIETVKRVGDLCSALSVLTLSSEAGPGDLKKRSDEQICSSLTKPFCTEALRAALEDALRPSQKVCQPFDRESRSTQETQEDIPSTGTWSQRVESLLLRIGSSDVPVLLQGETGVGKEVIARKLHAYSRRAQGPFVKLNCAALPSELVESELFGYERGAFTGAFKSTPGKFEMAHRGTILLDEIGDMDPKLQAKLLQVLQDQEFYRLGASESSRIDVRIMAASHCDFEKAITEKRFREDLYYRLNIVDIKIPPLRERRSEILPLCEAFLQEYSTAEWPRLEITPILRQVLLEYNWPGNVRELENVIRKYLVLRSPSILAAEIRQRTVRAKTVYVPSDNSTKHLSGFSENFEEGTPVRRGPEPVLWKFDPVKGVSEIQPNRQPVTREMPQFQDLPSRNGPTRALSAPADEGECSLSKVEEARRAAEVEAILNALNSSLWNRKRAATLLKVDYKALLYRMKKLGIGEKRTASVG